MKKFDGNHTTINVNNILASDDTDIGDTMEKEIGRRKIESMLQNPKKQHIPTILRYIELWNKKWMN